MSQAIANRKPSAAEHEVRAYDFQQAGRMSDAQIQALTGLHEGLVRNLAYALGNYLRVGCQLKLTGIEEIPFSQLAGQASPNCYTAAFELQPLYALGGIQLDLSLAFPMLELLLGGPGTPQALERGLSEMEEHLLHDVIRVVCAELEKTWKCLETSVNAGEHQKPAQLAKLLPPEERVLLLRMDAAVQESNGSFAIFFPVSIAAALLRKVAAPAIVAARPSAPPAALKMQERLMDCLCQLDLRVPGVKVSMQDILHLAPGKLLNLGIAANNSAFLCLEGQEWFSASPVRVGTLRGAKLASRVKVRAELGSQS
ncbi:MAG TPA: FliM/FliN family flagellar motor switch protein [Terriglobales bacterium]|nr:FliM/FliN family flagellar motor switch protein [Terriglobales bacterium]